MTSSMKIYRITTVALLLAGALTASEAQEGGSLTDRIMLDGMYRRHLGEFGEVWGSAAGGYVSYGMAFPDHNLLVIRTGYLSGSLADGVDYPDARLDILPLDVGGRYYFTGGRVMPFAGLMLGMDVIFENTNLDGEKVERTHAKFAWEFGIGATVGVAGSLAVDASANYASNFYEHDAMMTGFSYTVGIAWNFRD